MPLFPVLLLVFRLRDVLVALRQLRALARLVEIQLAGVFGAHRHLRQEPLEVVAVAFRTSRRVTGPHELLEFVVARAALVLVNRHGRENITRSALAQIPWGGYTGRSVGAWLSLVEHSVRDRGVGGSNPLAPTKDHKRPNSLEEFGL